METFKDLTLSEPLSRAIEDMGFTKPSPIQAQALPILLGEPTDFIGLAATGTGKTAAFAIPMLEKLDTSKRGVQAIILCPTRELSLQVAGQVNLLGKHLKVHALPIYGGAGYEEQMRGLRGGDQVVVGTPGRLIDHLERGTLKLDNVTTVILDEADEMISMGFRDDMETILQSVPREKSNIWLFSATMSGSVRKVADEFLKKPQLVQVNRTEMLSSTVEQYYYMAREKDKPEILCKLIDAADDFYGVVFCQTKSLVADLSRYLTDRGYRADCLHGDMSQSAREQIMAKFRAKKLRILVGTDVAARGIDVKDMTHVINYSIPRELDIYVHRIGRTARSGKTGFAMSLVTPTHRHLLGKIEKMTKSRILEGVIPSRKAIGVKKIAHALEKILDQKSFDRAVELMNDAWKEALSSMSGEEIAARFLSLMYPEVFADSGRPEMVREARPELEREKRRQDSRGPRRDFGSREERPYTPRRDRDEGEFKPRRPREDAEFKPRRDFVPRDGSDRPFRPRMDAARADRPYSPRREDSPRREEPRGDRPFQKERASERPFVKRTEKREDKRFGTGGAESRAERPYAARSEKREERPYAARAEKPRFEKSSAYIPKTEKSREERPRNDKYASKRREVVGAGGGFKPRKELAREAKARAGEGNHPPRRSRP